MNLSLTIRMSFTTSVEQRVDKTIFNQQQKRNYSISKILYIYLIMLIFLKLGITNLSCIYYFHFNTITIIIICKRKVLVTL